MSDLLTDIRRDISARLEELRPAVTEYGRLQGGAGGAHGQGLDRQETARRSEHQRAECRQLRALEFPAHRPDHELAEAFAAPLEQIAKKRRELSSIFALPPNFHSEPPGPAAQAPPAATPNDAGVGMKYH